MGRRKNMRKHPPYISNRGSTSMSRTGGLSQGRGGSAWQPGNAGDRGPASCHGPRKRAFSDTSAAAESPCSRGG